MKISHVDTDGNGKQWSDVDSDSGKAIARFYGADHRNLAEEYVALVEAQEKRKERFSPGCPPPEPVTVDAILRMRPSAAYQAGQPVTYIRVMADLSHEVVETRVSKIIDGGAVMLERFGCEEGRVCVGKDGRNPEVCGSKVLWSGHGLGLKVSVTSGYGGGTHACLGVSFEGKQGSDKT